LKVLKKDFPEKSSAYLLGGRIENASQDEKG